MPDRIQLRRTKGWRKPDNTVVVARPSIWGNPWKTGNPGHVDVPELFVVYLARLPIDRQSAVNAYRLWLAGEIAWWMQPTGLLHPGTFDLAMEKHRALILARLPELRGQNLACWCPPGCPCHADVLLDLANG